MPAEEERPSFPATFDIRVTFGPAPAFLHSPAA